MAEDLNKHPLAEEDLNKLYPPSEKKVIAITGSIPSGFQFWGPFDTMAEAVKWSEANTMFRGYISIAYVNLPRWGP